MERLCERPGCSDPASVAYGMRPEDLVFWLDALHVSAPPEHGVLCRRHADTMVVPRGWTLDDLRDPDLHLFRPPTDESGPIRRPRARRPTAASRHEQLALGVDGPDAAATADSTGDADRATDRGTGTGADTESGSDTGSDAGDEPAPWMPVFDTDDDLDGLLDARSPLLARAFRGERSS